MAIVSCRFPVAWCSFVFMIGLWGSCLGELGQIQPNDQNDHNGVIHLDERLLTSLEKRLMDDAPCVLCKFMVEKMEKALESILDKDVYGECMKLINNTTVCAKLEKTIQVAINDLMKMLTPEYACVKARFCDRESVFTVQVKQNVGLVKAIAPNHDDGVICDLCKSFTQQVDNGLHWLLDQLKNTLDNVCAALPETTAQECNKLVGQYYAQIEQLIDGQLNPDTVCGDDLNLC